MKISIEYEELLFLHFFKWYGQCTLSCPSVFLATTVELCVDIITNSWVILSIHDKYLSQPCLQYKCFLNSPLMRVGKIFIKEVPNQSAKKDIRKHGTIELDEICSTTLWDFHVNYKIDFSSYSNLICENIIKKRPKFSSLFIYCN